MHHINLPGITRGVNFRNAFPMQSLTHSLEKENPWMPLTCSCHIEHACEHCNKRPELERSEHPHLLQQHPKCKYTTLAECARKNSTWGRVKSSGALHIERADPKPPPALARGGSTRWLNLKFYKQRKGQPPTLPQSEQPRNL